MSNSLHLPSGFEFLSGGHALPVIAAIAAVVVLIVLVGTAFRHAGHSVGGTLWGGALVLLGALVASALTWVGDDAALRR